MGMMMPMGSHGSSGAVDSLLAKLDAARAAFSRRQPSVAVQLLEAFIHEVKVQNGKRIDAERASHLMARAQTIIDAIVASPAAKPAFLKAGLSPLQRVETATHSAGSFTEERTLRPAGALDSKFKA